MSNTKKHGCLWWLLIGWWWWLLIGWWWSILKWQSSRYLRMVQGTTPKPAPQQTAPQQTIQQAIPQKASTPAPVDASPRPKVERHRVAGTSFYLSAIQSLGVENSDYDKNKRELIEEGLVDERIYRTDFFPLVTTLEPEPDNPEDPKAIKVVVDGVHIGYIKAGSCAHIHKALRDGRIKSIKSEIQGGKYKIILEDFNEDGDSTYTLERDEIPLYADIFITLN